MPKIKVSPSILSADFGCLDKELKRLEAGGADMVHIDVMDGHFAPNITIGAPVIKDIRRSTKLPLDVHLMIENPQKYIDAFLDSGSDMITLHIETISIARLKIVKSKLKSKGVKLGISLNPSTPLAKVKAALKLVDFVLVMSVNPGFSGQGFMPSVLPKIKKLRSIFKGDIAVDGGINERTAKQAINSGANILASGAYVFCAQDIKSAIERIRNAGG